MTTRVLYGLTIGIMLWVIWFVLSPHRKKKDLVFTVMR